MLTIVLASHNRKKAEELQTILAALDARVITPEEATGAAYIPPEETGLTFEENAYIKARAALDATWCISLADDSGLCVDALGGAPGVYSARYGNLRSDGERNEYLLRQMEGITERKARFVCAVVCLFPDGKGGVVRLDARGECAGEILTAPRGTGGFGYDPLFYLPGFEKTMAELAPEEKNRVSHRGAALQSLLRQWPGR